MLLTFQNVRVRQHQKNHDDLFVLQKNQQNKQIASLHLTLSGLFYLTPATTTRTRSFPGARSPSGTGSGSFPALWCSPLLTSFSFTWCFGTTGRFLGSLLSSSWNRCGIRDFVTPFRFSKCNEHSVDDLCVIVSHFGFVHHDDVLVYLDVNT